MKKLFCYLDSSGNIEHTNLQLYSLRKAARCWNELINDLVNYDEANIENQKERLVFIVSCFGLSLSQLFGQNWPSDYQDKMDTPGHLLSKILNSSHIVRDVKKRLNKGFQDILLVYGAIRHFGKVKNEKNYVLVDKLDLPTVDRFRKLTIDLWDMVIAVQRSNDLNKIDDFKSIAEKVIFDEPPEKVNLDDTKGCR